MWPTLRVQHLLEGHTWVAFIFHKFVRLILRNLLHELAWFGLQEFFLALLSSLIHQGESK